MRELGTQMFQRGLKNSGEARGPAPIWRQLRYIWSETVAAYRSFGYPSFRLILSLLPVNLMSVRSCQAEKIVVKRFIQGRNNATKVGVEPINIARS